MKVAAFISRLVWILALCAGIQSTAWAQPANDEPCNATALTVSNGCTYVASTNTAATPSAGVAAPGCGNYTGGDVWFSAVVPNNGWLIFDMLGDAAGITDGAMALYTGTCGALTLVSCDAAGSANVNMPSISQTGLAAGTTVFIRVWSEGTTPLGSFSICARKGINCNQQTSNSSCATADIFCTGVSTDYCNTTGVASLGSNGIYGCLGSTPNPSFYSFNVATTGPIDLQISQQTAAGVALDVDYVIWGPFNSQGAICGGISAANIVSCSYSIAAVENASIPNAIAGEYYMVLITNFSNQAGFINFVQTNSTAANAGTTNCNGMTTSPGGCATGLYTLTGAITAPGANNLTGTLTITTSCGGSTTINGPFTSPINYSIAGLTGNGNACVATAVFSNPLAPVINPVEFNAPSCCVSNSSNSSCTVADPFCTGNNVTVCNTTGVASLGGGGIYGCLASTPNPAFYSFNVQQGGPIDIIINQTSTTGTAIDVDFVVWGPFTNQASMCNSLSATNIVDCSFSAAAAETLNIATSQAGDWYMLLVTNFSNLSGTINFFQSNATTPGAGVTNCNILTANPSACSNGTYSVSGYLFSQSPPTTGSVTITNSCNGQSQTFNAPFSSYLNYTFSNLCGNGQTCQITAVYSDGTPSPQPATYTAPNCRTLTATPSACDAATGTYSVSGTFSDACPPTSGTLTITSSCGGSAVFNAPFTLPVTYNFPGICANGGACTVSGVYSASAAPIVPATYTAPTCVANVLTATPGPCAIGLYTLTGTLSGSCLPTTGTLTIATSCGTQQVFNAPFANPLNFTFPNLDGSGLNCTVTAIFSATGAPVFTPVNYQAPYCCESTTLNTSCATADPFCAGNGFNYCNTINQPSLGSGGIYGCLSSTPNPAFYYLNVASTGAIDVTITQANAAGTPLDVDFVLWGPFTSQSTMCTGLTAANIVDCSYSIAATEVANIPLATAGQWYMILITNFSNQPGVVNFYQSNSSTAGSGTTNCNLITAAPGACVSGKYSVTGTVTLNTPPTSGNLTISNNCGGSPIVYNYPFAPSYNYTFSNLCGNGQNCTVSALFSATGASAIVPATYTAPNCNSITATPSACSGNSYTLNGTVTVGCPPASGTLTVTTSCGGNVIIAAPFPATGVIPYSIANVTGNGLGCTVTAVFSGSGGPIVPSTTYTAPYCCSSLSVSIAPTTSTICSGGAGVALTGTSNAAPVTNTYANNNVVVIPDGTANNNINPSSPSYASSPIAISGACGSTVTASTIVNVTFNITHTWQPDVVVWLQSPSGTFVRLMRNIGGTGGFTNTTFSSAATNVIGSVGNNTSPYTGTFAPTTGGAFSSFVGSPINGTWTLWVGDDVGIDTGSLTNWSITFTNPPTYTWAPAAGLSSSTTLNTTANPTATTTYTLTSTNACGCTGSANATVNVVSPSVSLSYSSITVCPGANGSATFTGTPGALVTYNINGGANLTAPINTGGTAIISLGVLTTTTVIQIVSIATQTAPLCTTTAPTGSNIWTETINVPSALTAVLSGPTSICSGATATITITGTPNANVTYSVTGVTPNPVVNLGASGSATITTPALSSNITYTLLSISLATCSAALTNQLSISVAASVTPAFSAIGPFCYNATAPALPTTSTNGVQGTWSPALINTMVVGTTNYTFTPNAGGCASTPVVVPVVVWDRPIVYAHGTNPTCSTPPCNGTANVDVVGGTAPYTYNWSNGGTTAALTALCPGTYNITVTDANGCQSQAFTPVAGCFQIQSILVDACAGSEWLDEMVFFQVGNAPLNPTLLNVTWPAYTASGNLQDPWQGLCTNPTFITNVNATITGGGVLLPVPANGLLPANSNVVLVTNSTTTGTSNSFANLSDTLYVLFQCPGSTIGHFGNNASTSAVRTLLMNFGASCTDAVSYDVALLTNQNGVAGGVGNAALNNGATVNYSQSNVATYVNYGCVAPFTTQDNSLTLTAPNPIPTAFDPVGPYCSGAAIPALPTSSTNTPAVTGTWLPALSNTATTTYTFTPTAGLCANTTTMQVVIYPLPTVTVNSPTICAGGTATVTATPGAVGTYTYAWTVPAGVTPPGNVASFNTTVAGTYGVTITSTGTPACTSLPASGTVTITTPPTVTVNSSTICAGASATVTAAPGPAGTYTYAWTVPSGVTNPGNVASFSASVAGTYSVVVSTSSVPVCSSLPGTGTITIAPLPTVTVNSPMVCPGTPATITASVQPAVGLYNYVWTVPSGASNPGNVSTFNTTVAGSYSVIATSTGTPACSSASASGSVALNDIIDYANLQFPASGTICTNGSFNAFGQFYNTGAVNTPGAGAATGVTVQIGYSTSNTDPSTWTNWSAATYNAAVTGNNDEYQGTLSGLAAGTYYYYTFRYQINGCAWQYGGYNVGGGGFWNGTTNVNGVLTVTAIPDAGNDATLNLCASGSTLNLYNSLGALAVNTGAWTGPSSLTGGYLGTFNPASNAAGVYKYKVGSGTCADSAFVTVIVGASPSATLSYASPVCATAPLALSPIIVGSTGPNPQFTISPTTGVSVGASTGVVTSAGNPTPGTYTVTYTIPADAQTGCSAFVTTAQIVVTAAPAVPTLTPASFCANTPVTFTAGNGAVYEFFVNGVSQGPASATSTYNTTGIAAGVPVCVRSYPQVPVLDGNIAADATIWGAPLATSAGGATSASGNRIDGLYLRNMNGVLYGAVAGAEIDGTTQAQNNRVLIFLDTKPSFGFNSLAAWTNRNGVPVGAPAFQDGIKNLSSGITFDAGFAPDYILAMNCANSNTPSTAYFDLYDMNADVNVYLGSGTNVAGAYGYQANAAAGALDKGFEFGVPMASIGSPTGSFKAFVMLVNDPNTSATTTVSNQFLTHANPGQLDFGNGNINFNNEPPNPVVFALGSDCYTETCVTGVAPTTTTVPPLGPLCYGAPATLPNPGVSGTWNPPLIANTTVGTATYTFTPAAGACATSTTLNIQILPQILTSSIFHN